MPEGSTLEQTAAVTRELADFVGTVPEVVDYQLYVGTASPYNFNGLVGHYFLRRGSMWRIFRSIYFPRMTDQHRATTLPSKYHRP